MPKCVICGNWFIGGENEKYKNVCMYCYIEKWAINIINNHRKNK